MINLSILFIKIRGVLLQAAKLQASATSFWKLDGHIGFYFSGISETSWSSGGFASVNDAHVSVGADVVDSATLIWEAVVLELTSMQTSSTIRIALSSISFKIVIWWTSVLLPRPKFSPNNGWPNWLRFVCGDIDGGKVNEAPFKLLPLILHESVVLLSSDLSIFGLLVTATICYLGVWIAITVSKQ